MNRIARTIAIEIGARAEQVSSAVKLLDEGATVPFIARYRKEVTGGLDDTQLRNLSERLTYLRELDARRDTILKSIKEQGKLTQELAGSISSADTKAELEDIYLPFKPKRRTKAMIARENGLAPLAEAILKNRTTDPDVLAHRFVNEAVPTNKDALNGARDIITESLSENATLLKELRTFMQREAVLTSKLIEGKQIEGAKYSDYFDHSELWSKIPSHRALAMLRASKEGIVTLDIAPEADTGSARAEAIVAAHLNTRSNAPGDVWLRKVAGWTWRVKLSLSMMVELMADLRTRAQEDAIKVFSRNLKDLLFAAPAGSKATLGLDPGIRTGVKAAVVDGTGKLVATDTLYPFQPKNDGHGAQLKIISMIEAHGIELIAIGNGTASRETEKLVRDTLKLMPKSTKAPKAVVVSEAGASVYSASELAAREFPDLDVSLRGAVSIARRLQDPLAELVKIEPKSIGVGQYQHDVDQHKLSQSLASVIEDVVNAVGVDLNTASAPLLSHVSGLGPGLAEAIVAHRDNRGSFTSREELLNVPRLGPRAYEQSAGFLRINNGAEPLDASSVHPEAYDVARRIVSKCGRDIRQILGNESTLQGVNPEQFVDETFGLPTVLDIFAELKKPGRDPRPDFVTASFADGIDQLTDLKPGMVLEGTVTNVAAFGAFVDIGVHQDGLVHVSQLAERYVNDPHEVIKTGQVVKVTVIDVDVDRKRIGLTMRKHQPISARPKRTGLAQKQTLTKATKQGAQHAKNRSNEHYGALGDALKSAIKKN